MSGYTVAKLDEIEEMSDARCPWRPIRHHLGIQAFGINAWVPRGAGQEAINEHDETDTDEEELYFVLSGHAVFTIDGEEVDAPEGTLVLVEPEAKRSAAAKDEDTTILAVGGPRTEAYRPSGWEIWSPVRPAFEAGDYDRVIAELTPLADANPQYSALTYNLACAESLSGRTDDAIGHLRRALETEPKLAELARQDSDLDAIRDDPRFAELVG